MFNGASKPVHPKPAFFSEGRFLNFFLKLWLCSGNNNPISRKGKGNDPSFFPFETEVWKII